MLSKRLILRSLVFLFSMSVGLTLGHAQGLQPPAQDWVMRFHIISTAAAPASPNIILGETFTLEAWVYPESINQGGFILNKQFWGGNEHSWWYGLGYWDNRLAFGHWSSPDFGGFGGSVDYFPAQPFEIKKWLHVAVTRLADGELSLFLNGTKVAQGWSSGPCEPALNDIPLELGPTNFYGGISGSVCQVRVWDRALTSSELFNNASLYLSGGEAGLIAYWPFDDGPGHIARDLSSYGRSMILPSATGLDMAFMPRWTPTAVLTSGPYLIATQKIFHEGQTSDFTLLDFDNDGDLDIVTIGHPTLCAFRNNGLNVFEDVTSEVIIQLEDLPGSYAAMIPADFNGDGRTDLFAFPSGVFAHPYIFIQTADGQLVQEAESRFPADPFAILAIASGDIDHDGDLDIFMGGLTMPSFFLINDGNGYFSRKDEGLPQGTPAITSAVFADINNDCRNEMVVGYWYDFNKERNGILLNDGNGNFSFGPEEALPPKYGGSLASTSTIYAVDFDGDGYLDLSMGNGDQNIGWKLRLYLNNRDGTFREASDLVPIDYPEQLATYTIGPGAVGDFNADGRPDIYAGSTSSTKLFLNTGDPGALFVESTYLIGNPVDKAEFWSISSNGFDYITGAVSGDIDGDGDSDILFASHNGLITMLNHKSWPSAEPLPYPFEANLISPMNASNHQTLPTLQWTGVITAGSYQLQVAIDQYFNSIVFNRNGITCSFHQPATLTKGKDYYWRVRAINTRGAGPWSEVWSFYYGDIIPYTFEGFFSPIENLPVLNQASAGQVIPVKWRITDKNGLPISDPASFLGISSLQVSCSTFEGDPINSVDEVAAGNSGLQYLGNGWWQYNWKTSKSYQGQCRIMKLTLDDKSEHTASFSFK